MKTLSLEISNHQIAIDNSNQFDIIYYVFLKKNNPVQRNLIECIGKKIVTVSLDLLKGSTLGACDLEEWEWRLYCYKGSPENVTCFRTSLAYLFDSNQMG